MKTVPAAPETAHPAVGGRHGKGHEHEEGCEPDRHVGTLRNVGKDRLPVEPVVEHEPVGEVQGDVAEREEPEHAPQAHDPGQAQGHYQRRNAQCREQEPQAPLSQTVLQFVHRIHAQACTREAKRPRHEPG